MSGLFKDSFPPLPTAAAVPGGHRPGPAEPHLPGAGHAHAAGVAGTWGDSLKRLFLESP